MNTLHFARRAAGVKLLSAVCRAALKLSREDDMIWEKRKAPNSESLRASAHAGVAIPEIGTAAQQRPTDGALKPWGILTPGKRTGSE